MKKIFILIITILLITGCNKKKEQIITCTKKGTYTKYAIDKAIDPETIKDEDSEKIGANVTKIREYYLKKIDNGAKRIREILEIEYIIETDIEKQKAYYEKGCNNIGDNYTSCEVKQEGNKITITAELNLNSSEYSDLKFELTKKDILEATTDGTCIEN